jgi:hypothetical protein
MGSCLCSNNINVIKITQMKIDNENLIIKKSDDLNEINEANFDNNSKKLNGEENIKIENKS